MSAWGATQTLALAADRRAGPRADGVLAVGPRRLRPDPRRARTRSSPIRRSTSSRASSTSSTARRPEAATARALDAYFIVGAEHGFNASTFTARVITSTMSDIASAVAGAIGTMKGPLHGGAPSEVVDQLAKMGSVEHAEEWLRGALDRGERLMGFGHRVYRAYDPRAAALRKVAEGMEHKPDWLQTAMPGRGRRPAPARRAAPGSGAEDERRVLRRAGAAGRRAHAGSVPGDVLAGPPRRLDGPRPRAGGQQPADPARRPVRRARRARPPRLSQAGTACFRPAGTGELARSAIRSTTCFASWSAPSMSVDVTPYWKAECPGSQKPGHRRNAASASAERPNRAAEPLRLRSRPSRYSQPRRRNRITSATSIAAIIATTSQNAYGSLSPGTGTFIP